MNVVVHQVVEVYEPEVIRDIVRIQKAVAPFIGSEVGTGLLRRFRVLHNAAREVVDSCALLNEDSAVERAVLAVVQQAVFPPDEDEEEEGEVSK